MCEGVFLYFNQKPTPPLLSLLSFFQEYGDYALDKPEADSLMLSVTQQLSELELPGESANLLVEYYEKRLKIGSADHERAAVLIFHMATYMNQNRDFDKSIQWLTKVKQWPDSYKIKSEELLATAYLGIKKKEEALKVLGDNPVHAFLKGNIWFHEKEWEKAIPLYEQVLAEEDNSALKDDENSKGELVNKLAICYAMMRNNEALISLREKYDTLMNQGKNKDLFDFLTRTTIPSESLKDKLEEASKTLDFLTKIYPS